MIQNVLIVDYDDMIMSDMCGFIKCLINHVPLVNIDTNIQQVLLQLKMLHILM